MEADKIAHAKGIDRAELLRQYIEEGLKRDSDVVRSQLGSEVINKLSDYMDHTFHKDLQKRKEQKISEVLGELREEEENFEEAKLRLLDHIDGDTFGKQKKALLEFRELVNGKYPKLTEFVDDVLHNIQLKIEGRDGKQKTLPGTE